MKSRLSPANEAIARLDINDSTLISVDLETTGLSPRNGDEIVEIGAVKSRAGEIIDTYHTMIDPRRPMPPAATAVNGITSPMLAGQPLAADVFPSFLEFIGDAPLIAHNARFDMTFLAWKIAELGHPTRKNIVFDTLRLSRALRPGLPHYNLATLTTVLGIDVPVIHRAVEDAAITLTVFFRLVTPLITPQTPLRVGSVLKLQGNTVPWPSFSQPAITPGPASPLEETIARYIADRRTMVIIYQSPYSSTATTREINPLQLVRRPGKTYLVADCLLRNEQRTFRIDRISRIVR